MLWTAIIVAAAVSLVVFSWARCRRANETIGRILAEELGPRESSCREKPPEQESRRVASDALLGLELR